MKPQAQTVLGGGENGTEPGNCFAACVASIFEVDLADVPNFVAVPADQSWWLAFEKWCRELGWLPVLMESAWVQGTFDCVCIANGDGPRGRRHSVVWRGDAALFDPHLSREGLVGDPDHFVLFVALRVSRLRGVRLLKSELLRARTRISELVCVLDAQLGTPCQQIRTQATEAQVFRLQAVVRQVAEQAADGGDCAFCRFISPDGYGGDSHEGWCPMAALLPGDLT